MCAQRLSAIADTRNRTHFPARDEPGKRPGRERVFPGALFVRRVRLRWLGQRHVARWKVPRPPLTAAFYQGTPVGVTARFVRTRRVASQECFKQIDTAVAVVVTAGPGGADAARMPRAPSAGAAVALRRHEPDVA